MEKNGKQWKTSKIWDMFGYLAYGVHVQTCLFLEQPGLSGYAMASPAPREPYRPDDPAHHSATDV